MAPIYLGKRVVPSSLRYIENLASAEYPSHQTAVQAHHCKTLALQSSKCQAKCVSLYYPCEGYRYFPDTTQDNLGLYYVADWSEISRFEIHPLYNSIPGAFNYNVAVVQLKKKLEFGPDSRYYPICLPRCDHLCRTDSGWLQQDLVGSSVVVSRGTFEQNLKIITKTKCQKSISDKTPVTVQAGRIYYQEGYKIKRLV